MMPIIYKYLIREILRYVGIVLIMVVSIYLAVDFFEKIDDFMEAGLPLARAFPYFMLKVPFIVAQIIPVCLLLAVLVVFGLMSKNNELVALKSSGISIYYLLKPVLSLGIVFSILLFLLSEVLVPITMAEANRIWRGEVKKRSLVTTRERNIWIKGNRTIKHIKYYDPSSQVIFGVTLNYFDQDFRLVRRVDAKRAVFKEGKWVFYDVMEQRLDAEENNYAVMFHEKRVESFDMLPEDFTKIVKKSEAMSFTELLAYIKKVEAEGYDATIYRVDLHAKAAFPLVCIIMGILGTTISVQVKKKESMPLVIAYGVGIAFLYWIFHSFCVSLGYGEVLPPTIAAWTANLLFSCVGAVALLNAE